MKKSLLYLFVFIAIQFAVSFIVWTIWYLADGMTFRQVLHLFGEGKMSPGVTAMIVASIAYGVLTIVLFAWRRWCVMQPTYIRTRPWATLAWCAVIPFGTIVPLGVGQEMLFPGLEDRMANTFKALMEEPLGYITIGVFAPVVEEIVFRGAILRALLQRFSGRWVPIAISAVLFALVHANPAQMPAALLMGLLMGWMYSHTHSIAPGVMVHWVNNTLVFVLSALMPYASDITMVQLFGGQTRALMAVGFSLLIFLPAIYQLNIRFRRA